MAKIDFKKELKHLYLPSAKAPSVVRVPALQFLMIDGRGNPNTSPVYSEALEALFTVSYTLKFAVKKGKSALDYGVMPLEGLWWAEDMSAFTSGDKESWQWTMMILQPDFISAEMVGEAKAAALRKKDLESIGRLRLESYEEGLCAQIMHLGPFTDEGPTIERMHRHIEEQGGKLRGKHHEIYLSDIRRAAPEKWKTVLRQPFE